MIDVDHFKLYNDRNGHQVGDQALLQTARFLQTLIRDGDAVVRGRVLSALEALRRSATWRSC
jgi:diguanylate cyclase (GGDEF)-like protein